MLATTILQVTDLHGGALLSFGSSDLSSFATIDDGHSSHKSPAEAAPQNFQLYRNVLLLNTNADYLKVEDIGLSKLIKVKNSHDVYKMTGEAGSCDPPLSLYETYEAAKYIAAGHRLIFRAKTYGHELRELIEQCWAPDMNKIPSFLEIPKRLEKIEEIVPGDHHYNIFTS
ncbi:hypothetical protein LguiA_011906 [Lonicera macranthoides]